MCNLRSEVRDRVPVLVLQTTTLNPILEFSYSLTASCGVQTPVKQFHRCPTRRKSARGGAQEQGLPFLRYEPVQPWPTDPSYIEFLWSLPSHPFSPTSGSSWRMTTCPLVWNYIRDTALEVFERSSRDGPHTTATIPPWSSAWGPLPQKN